MNTSYRATTDINEGDVVLDAGYRLRIERKYAEGEVMGSVYVNIDATDLNTGRPMALALDSLKEYEVEGN